MPHYHCASTAGQTVPETRKTGSIKKPARVYMTTLLTMALVYTVRNHEFSCGYTKEGQIYYDEYFPHAFKVLYRGKIASLYRYDPESKGTGGAL